MKWRCNFTNQQQQKTMTTIKMRTFKLDIRQVSKHTQRCSKISFITAGLGHSTRPTTLMRGYACRTSGQFALQVSKCPLVLPQKLLSQDVRTSGNCVLFSWTWSRFAKFYCVSNGLLGSTVYAMVCKVLLCIEWFAKFYCVSNGLLSSTVYRMVC